MLSGVFLELFGDTKLQGPIQEELSVLCPTEQAASSPVVEWIELYNHHLIACHEIEIDHVACVAYLVLDLSKKIANESPYLFFSLYQVIICMCVCEGEGTKVSFKLVLRF